MIRVGLILGASLALAFPVHAQKKDSVRDKYVERFPDYFFIWPVIKQRSTSIQIEQIRNRSNSLTFKPNNCRIWSVSF